MVVCWLGSWLILRVVAQFWLRSVLISGVTCRMVRDPRVPFSTPSMVCELARLHVMSLRHGHYELTLGATYRSTYSVRHDSDLACDIVPYRAGRVSVPVPSTLIFAGMFS